MDKIHNFTSRRKSFSLSFIIGETTLHTFTNSGQTLSDATLATLNKFVVRVETLGIIDGFVATAEPHTPRHKRLQEEYSFTLTRVRDTADLLGLHVPRSNAVHVAKRLAAKAESIIDANRQTQQQVESRRRTVRHEAFCALA